MNMNEVLVRCWIRKFSYSKLDCHYFLVQISAKNRNKNWMNIQNRCVYSVHRYHMNMRRWATATAKEKKMNGNQKKWVLYLKTDVFRVLRCSVSQITHAFFAPRYAVVYIFPFEYIGAMHIVDIKIYNLNMYLYAVCGSTSSTFNAEWFSSLFFSFFHFFLLLM